MKQLYWLLTLILLLGVTACGQTESIKPRITVTIEPQRYFLEQLIDTLFEVNTMVPAGTSPETFDPSPRQIANLSQSTAYFAIGKIGFENVWLDRLQKNNPELPFFDNSVGVKWIRSEHTHSPGDHHHHHHGEDPHIWTSPREMQQVITNMYTALLALDSTHQTTYTTNYERLQMLIAETDSLIRSRLSASSQQAFLIYHPTLTYFARDYGLEQYAMEWEGKEPSAEQIKALVDAAQQKQVRTVFIQEEFDQKNAELIAKETGARLVTINPLSYDWPNEMIRIAQMLSYE